MRDAPKLAFVLVLSLLPVGLSRDVGIHQLEIREQSFPAPAGSQSTPCLKYTTLSSALTFSKQREPIELHSYSASDGTMVYARYSYYRSPEKAKREMTKRLASAIEIISRETLLDQSGKKIGVKVVGRFRSRTPGREFQVAWTDGANFKVITGPSLTHILQLLKPDCS